VGGGCWEIKLKGNPGCLSQIDCTELHLSHTEPAPGQESLLCEISFSLSSAYDTLVSDDLDLSWEIVLRTRMEPAGWSWLRVSNSWCSSLFLPPEPIQSHNCRCLGRSHLRPQRHPFQEEQAHVNRGWWKLGVQCSAQILEITNRTSEDIGGSLACSARSCEPHQI
jgi:hypothetical protein